MRKFSVAFAEKNNEESTTSQTVTEINELLKVLYFKIVLDEKSLSEPKLMFGVFYNISKKKDWVKKFENLMGTLEYVDNKLFSTFPDLEYGDGTFKISGHFGKVKLLDINSSEELLEKVIKPAIKLYEKS